MSEIKKVDIIEPGVKDEINEISKAFNTLIDSIDGVVKSGSQLNDELKKGAKTRKETESLNQKAVNNSKALEKNTIKLGNLQTNYTKSLVALNKQKEKEAKATDKQTKANKKLMAGIKAEVGSIQRLNYENKRLIAARNKINGSTANGAKEIIKLNKQIDKNNKAIKSQSSGLEKQKINIGKYTSAFGPLGKAMDLLAVNPFFAAITALGALFTGLYKAMTRSEEGQDKLNRVMEIGGAVIGKLMDYVTKFATVLFDAFTDPKQAIKDLWGFIKSQFINRIHALQKVLIGFGDLMKAVWELDPAKAKKAAKDMGNAYVDAITGVENTLDKVAEAQANVTDEINESVKAAQKAAALESALNKVKRSNLITNAEIAGKVAKLEAKAEELKKSNASAAIKLTKQAQALQNRILVNKQNEAELEYELIKAKAAQSANDIEMNNKVAAAKEKLIRADNAFAEKQRADARKINTLIAERKRQINEVVTAQTQANTANAKSIVENNKKVIASTKSTEAEKLEALKQSEDAQLAAINTNTTVIIDGYKKQLDAKLVTQDTYAQLEKAALEKQSSQELAIINKTEQQKTKIQTAAQKQRFDEKFKLAANSNAEEIRATKALYIQGEITAEEANARIANSAKSAATQQIEILQELLASKQLTANQEELVQNKLFDAKLKLIDEDVAATKKAEEAKKKLIADSVQAASKIVNEGFNFYKAMNEAELNDLEKSQQFELQMAGDNEAAKAKINEKYDAKRKKIQHDQAVADKAQAMFNIALTTGQAIMAALASVPPNVPLSIAMGVIGALQLAAVAAKTIPEFDIGTDSAPKGGFIGGEKRPEIIIQGGKASLITEPTYFGDSFAGSRIIGGEETAQILNNGLMNSIKLNSEDVYNGLELRELKAIRHELSRNKTNVLFDKKGITTIYGQSRSKLTRIDKYIN